MNLYINIGILFFSVLKVIKMDFSIITFLLLLIASAICTSFSFFRLGICTGPRQRQKDLNSFINNVIILGIITLILIGALAMESIKLLITIFALGILVLICFKAINIIRSKRKK